MLGSFISYITQALELMKAIKYIGLTFLLASHVTYLVISAIQFTLALVDVELVYRPSFANVYLIIFQKPTVFTYWKSNAKKKTCN